MLSPSLQSLRLGVDTAAASADFPKKNESDFLLCTIWALLAYHCDVQQLLLNAGGVAKRLMRGRLQLLVLAAERLIRLQQIDFLVFLLVHHVLVVEQLLSVQLELLVLLLQTLLTSRQLAMHRLIFVRHRSKILLETTIVGDGDLATASRLVLSRRDDVAFVSKTRDFAILRRQSLRQNPSRRNPSRSQANTTILFYFI